MTAARARRIVTGSLTYAAIIVVTLLLIDGVCIMFNLFPPTYNYGDLDLGWRPARATGRMELGKCSEFSAGETITYQRNEDGVRVGLDRPQIASDTTSVKIAITGDSQTDLCAPNSLTHWGVLESELVSKGIRAIAVPYGAGKFSPLQDYLAFRKVLRPYRPQILVMNVYTGNDFHDILRVDDRPHFARIDSTYRIAEPVWYTLDNPMVRRKSRVMFALRSLADKVGVRQFYLRVSELRRLSAQQGGGVTSIVAYMRDLWRAGEPTVGYSNAFTAQFLNQQLFFHHFPSGREESLRRLRALMRLARTENPDVMLVMSPLPSYELTGEKPVDQALVRTLGRLPITYEGGVEEERALYEHLRSLATDEGWAFVDNLAALQGYAGSERLYNDFDYHFLPVASALIGRAQAAVLADRLRGIGAQTAPPRE
jgi:hypothetical protein